MSDEKAPVRQCLYGPGGHQIFDGQEAIDAALEGGFVDHPDKVKKPAAKKKAAKKKGK